jgi:prephenate dehydrogenase
VVTDVSGVKSAIVDEADHPRFIGGHPMAGSEQTGLRGADPDLFEGAVWVLTPTAATDLESFDRLKGVVMSLGADVLVLSAADHDRLVAVVSHVPHLVAATLMNAATDSAEQDRALLRLAAGGFRDMTRVAAGHPGIWPDICTENAAAIIDALDALMTDLDAMRARVARGDRPALLASLEKASAARRNLPARAVRPEHLAELRIRVPDRAGVLAEITRLAADAGIGIYDIEIAHSAEGPTGVLILVVDGAEADTLADAVTARGYPCRAEQLS